MFTPRGRPGPGRPKGAPNKTTIVMKEAIAAVFEDLQVRHKGEGRFPHFLAWAEANPTEFYRIAARQLPVQVEAGGAIGLVVFRGIND
jgi:hypothetical protein